MSSEDIPLCPECDEPWCEACDMHYADCECVPQERTARDVLNELSEYYGELLVADGFDEAIIGLGERCGSPPIVCYDRSLCIKKLMDDGASYDEAEEHFEFNVLGSWVGESTPIFIQLFKGETHV